MSELLNSLNVPSEQPAKSWAQEVADAEAAAPAPEPVAAEPAPEPAKTAETAVEPSQPQETATEQDDRRVPLKALQEERQKRSEYERKLADYERRFAELEQRVPKAAEPAPPQIPDPETDPIAALKYVAEENRKLREEAEQQHRVASLNQIAYQSATAFKEQAPDYPDAYRYAINSRAQELAALGPPPDWNGTEQQYTRDMIPKILQMEELNLIDTALRNNGNPAEVIYRFAKARGFNATAPAPAAPAPVPPPAPAPVNPALQQAKQAVAASAAAGGAPAAKGEMSVNDIANLKGAAFDAAWNKLFGGNKSSIFRE
jgi:hypothetical protein